MAFYAERARVRRSHKDGLFRLMMSEKQNIMDVYNALNGTEYDREEDFEITTLEDVVYVHHKNDVSVMIDCGLWLFEQQSTYNPNMPLRGLFYFAALYQNIIGYDNHDIYSGRLIKIPTPRYIVFYNGTEPMEDTVRLKLSDAYEKKGRADLELTVTVININRGRNKELLGKSRVLSAFSIYNEKIRCYNKTMQREEAVSQAIDECISEGVMPEFFRKRRSEVESMILTEFDEKKYAEAMRRWGREEGMEAGLEAGKTEGMAEAVLKVLEELGEVPPDVRERIMNERDPQELSRLLKLAVRSPGMPEFKAQM